MNPKDSRIAWYIKQLTKLSLNPRIKIVGYDKDEFLDIINLLFGPIVDEKGNPLFPEDFRYLACALYQLEQISSMEEYLQRRSVPQEAIEGAKNLVEIKPKEKEALAQAKTKVGRFIQEQEELARQANQLSASQLAQVEKNITQEIERTIRERAPQLVRNQPEVVDKLVEEFKEEVLTNCFESPRQTLNSEAYQAIIDQALPRIDLVIAEENIPLAPEEKENLEQGLKEIARTTLAEASTLTQIDFKLPKAVQEKMPVQGTAFPYVAAAFHPGDLIRKFVGLPVKATQVATDTEISGTKSIEEQLEKELKNPRRDLQKISRLVGMLQEAKEFKTTNRELTYSVHGVASEDLGKSIEFLRKELGAGHPIVRFLEIQKVRQERFEAKYPRATGRAKSFFSLNRQLGQAPSIEVRGTSFSLPVFEPATGLRGTLDNIGLATRLYRVVKFPGGEVIESMAFRPVAAAQNFIYQRAVQPIIVRLGRTAIGKSISTGISYVFKEGTKKAITEGLKKAGTWLATRAGLHGVIQAIGAGSAAFTAGLSLLISAAVSLLIEAGSWILGKIKEIIRKPENALALVGGSVLIFVLLPMPFALVGLFPAAIGGLGLMAGAGGILGGFASGVAAFFVALAAPFAAPIGLLVGGIIGGLAIITFFIVMLTASAFIIPASPEKIAEVSSVYLRVTKTASQYQIENKELSNNPSVSYTMTITAAQPVQITSITDKRSVSCRSGTPPQIETPVNIPPPSNPVTYWKWPDDNSYQLTFGPGFEDCRVCNTVAVIGNVVDGPTGERSSHTACVKIGNPPEDCPSGWPTEHGYITQGPHGSYSHANQEAIDIGTGGVMGVPVYATHEGEVIEPAGWRDLTVMIRGDCSGRFISIYTHLRTRAVRPGDHVHRGDLIGTTNHPDPHLHYEFTNLQMIEPYIDISDDELEGCVGKADCGNVQW